MVTQSTGRRRALMAVVAVVATGAIAGGFEPFASDGVAAQKHRTAVVPSDLRQPQAASGESGSSGEALPAFDRPIRVDPIIDRKSEEIAEYLVGDGAAYANMYEFGTPIYYANRSTPRVNVQCTKPWGKCELEQQRLPIPLEAEPNTGSDAAMVVVNRETGDVLEFWQAERQANGDWWTSWGEIVSDADNGGFGSTGSGISRLAGVIRTDEIRAGVIPHALVFSTDNACRVVFRTPATKTDGRSTRPDCIPEGARVQLDPAVNLSGLELSRAERAVAVALQRYGAYAIDNGLASMAISFELPTGGHDPYPAAGLRWDFFAMDDIPWKRLRVLSSWDGS